MELDGTRMWDAGAPSPGCNPLCLLLVGGQPGIFQTWSCCNGWKLRAGPWLCGKVTLFLGEQDSRWEHPTKAFELHPVFPERQPNDSLKIVGLNGAVVSP